jgi:hypothetical protein
MCVPHSFRAGAIHTFFSGGCSLNLFDIQRIVKRGSISSWPDSCFNGFFPETLKHHRLKHGPPLPSAIRRVRSP